MKAVVASRNKHKVAEIRTLLGDLDIELVSIDDVAPDVELHEREHSFEGNALSKARQAAAATGLPAFADDSGLEVDALDGAPGVHSARYAGEPCDDARNNAKLLDEMRDVPAAQRTARYRCAAVFIHPGSGVEVARHGACEGTITREPRGTGGFGYDPLFQLPGRPETMAEISVEEKNTFSHRGDAFRALGEAMREIFLPEE